MARRPASITIEPLGSLLTTPRSHLVTCTACGSQRTTKISMVLTDGSTAAMTSCRRCERRSWTSSDGASLTREDVLLRTRKVA